MIDQIKELPEDGLKPSLETSRYTENKRINQKNQNKLYFLHLIDNLNDLLLIMWVCGQVSIWGERHWFQMDRQQIKN